MRARLYATRAEADAALAARDAAAGLPRVYAEGEYTIAQPGNAAARLRARGVRREHVAAIVPNEAGTQWALPAAEGDAEAVEIDLRAWRGSARDGGLP